MNGLVPGTTVSYTIAKWTEVLIAVDITIALLLTAGVAYVIATVRKRQEGAQGS